MRLGNLCFAPDDGAAEGGGGNTTTDKTDLDDLKATVKATRKERDEAKRAMKAIEDQLAELKANQTSERAKLLKALGHDDGSDDPETLNKTIAKLQSDLKAKENEVKRYAVMSRFRTVAKGAHDPEDAFSLAGISVDEIDFADTAKIDDYIKAKVEALRESKAYLFAAEKNGDSGDSKAIGAGGPDRGGKDKPRYSLDEYRKITNSREFLKQAEKGDGDLLHEMRAAMREGRVASS